MTEFAPLKNDLLLRAARGEKTELTPVWVMRQAGRYLPEYRTLRTDEDFFAVCRTPELAAEVTLQPIERFSVDAAIIFSDILVVPQAMGLEVQMIPGTGPHFPEPLRNPDDFSRLHHPDVQDSLHYVFEAITLTRKSLSGRVPLIGFCGAPWTLMAYMVEGGGSKTFARSKTWLYRYPLQSHMLLKTITSVLIEFLAGQIEAGAQAIQVFDSWAGMLGPNTFEQFALPYLKKIVSGVKEKYPDIPCIVFAKGANYALESLAGSGYDVIGLDWTVDPASARQLTGSKVALQGNLDPAVLYAEGPVIREEVRHMLQAFGPVGHIANLGHGVYPDHNPECVKTFVDSVHEISAEIRS